MDLPWTRCGQAVEKISKHTLVNPKNMPKNSLGLLFMGLDGSLVYGIRLVLVWLGLVELDMAWLGLAWLDLVWFGLAWLGLVWLALTSSEHHLRSSR